MENQNALRQKLIQPKSWEEICDNKQTWNGGQDHGEETLQSRGTYLYQGRL